MSDEPTPAMIAAGERALVGMSDKHWGRAEACWKAMIAFADAPRPESASGGAPVLRLVTVYDNGEHDPHEAEQCGVFFSPEDVRSYVAKRFADGAYRADPHGDPDDLTWNLVDRKTGQHSDLILHVWRETAYGAPAPRPTQVAETREAIARIIDPEGTSQWTEHAWKFWRNRRGTAAERLPEPLAKADAILAALPQHDGEGWRPIETAPKDGTWFLAAQDGEIYPCEWLTEEYDEGPPTSGWYDHFNESFEDPTHWRPLPAPPIAEDRDDG